MSLPSLYHITNDMLAVMEADDATPEMIEAAFGKLQEKDNRIAFFRADLKGEIEKFKAEEKRIAERRKAMENCVTRLENYLLDSMTRLGINELNTGTFKISLQASPPALVEVNGKETPNGYLDIIPEQHVPAKDRIKDALKKGEEVPGWELRQGVHVRIR